MSLDHGFRGIIDVRGEALQYLISSNENPLLSTFMADLISSMLTDRGDQPNAYLKETLFESIVEYMAVSGTFKPVFEMNQHEGLHVLLHDWRDEITGDYIFDAVIINRELVIDVDHSEEGLLQAFNNDLIPVDFILANNL
jgi:hypothetical protein